MEYPLDPKAEHARLPPLILQPLVENAVRHGVEPSESGATVRISTVWNIAQGALPALLESVQLLLDELE